MALDRRGFLCGLLACPACAAAAGAAEPGHHWTYEGEAGAAKWGELEPGFKACAVGSEQSPIDLTGARRAAVDAVTLDWKPHAFKIVNNGHTIQADAAAGHGMMLAGDRFELKQFHFHTPSEHALDGKRLAMEAHFVHADAHGRLAVIGVFLTPGRANPAFAAIMAAAPKKEGEHALDKPLDIEVLLPTSRSLFRYEGSLTTPPCSEVVAWNVYEQPIEVAQKDIDAFKALFPMNARPLQARNRRFLLKG
jgi:carbonic anhydrase